MYSGNRTKSNRKRSPKDFYATPIELCRKVISVLDVCGRVLDPGCGTGNWGKAAQEHGASLIVGVEIQEELKIEHEYCYDDIQIGNFLDFNWEDYGSFDFVIGNPPFSLLEEFFIKSLECVSYHGYVALLAPLSFLASKKRYFGLYKDYPLNMLLVSSRRPSWYSTVSGRHTTDTIDYGMFVWRKTNSNLLETRLDWIYWDYD